MYRIVVLLSECRINPSPDVCRQNQEREYYTFSSKSNTCVRISGCFSIYDRNVFLTRGDCNNKCFVYSGVTPSGAVDARKDMSIYTFMTVLRGGLAQ